MRRREFLGVLGGAIAWPFAAHGQQALRRAGLLLPGTPASHGAYASTFTRGVEQAGLSKDRNFALDVVYAEGRLDRIPALIAELVGRNVDVLAAGSTGAGTAAKQATSTIPVVFVSGDDPVRVGLVQSINRPGGNVTGVSLFATELIQKRIGLLLELSPAATVMGFLANPANPNAELDIKQVLATAGERGQQAAVVNASRDNEIDVAFAMLAEKRATTLLSHSDPFLNSRRGRIIELATRNRMIANFPLREYAAGGGLSSYGVNFADSYRQAGFQAGQILKGAKPGDLPVLQPTKFEFVINIKTASALGLTVPDRLLALADEVIE